MVTPLIVVINIIMFAIYHVWYGIVLIVYRFVRKSKLKIGYFVHKLIDINRSILIHQFFNIGYFTFTIVVT